MKAKKRSNKKKWITLGIVAIVIVGAATFLMKPKTTTYESVTAKTGDITTYYSFSGNVETKSRQSVLSEKVMQIADINFKEGDTVKEGDVLMTSSTEDEILSKIDGIITNVFVEENAQVMTGVKLMEIVDNNDLQIKVKVDEYDINALTVDTETTVKIGAIDKEITGKVKSLSEEGQIINGVTYFTATINLEEDSSVKIGMSAEVTVISDAVTGVVTLPMTVILFDDANLPYVLKEDDKGAAVKTEITTGINDGTTVEITSGVSNGETILYTNNSTATTGGMGFGGGANRSATNGGEN